MDHSLEVARDAKNKLEAIERAHADKKLKKTLTQLAEVEKARRNAESTFKGYEKQATDTLEAQRKAENKIVMTVVELKQKKKKLDDKAAEMAQVEQAAYDMGMTKTAKSLTVQLKDVARAFCLEVWSQALNTTGVNTESELKAPDKFYYPPALHLAPISQQPPADPTSTPPVSSDQPVSIPPSTPTKGKE